MMSEEVLYINYELECKAKTRQTYVKFKKQHGTLLYYTYPAKFVAWKNQNIYDGKITQHMCCENSKLCMKPKTKVYRNQIDLEPVNSNSNTFYLYVPIFILETKRLNYLIEYVFIDRSNNPIIQILNLFDVLKNNYRLNSKVYHNQYAKNPDYYISELEEIEYNEIKYSITHSINNSNYLKSFVDRDTSISIGFYCFKRDYRIINLNDSYNLLMSYNLKEI